MAPLPAKIEARFLGSLPSPWGPDVPLSIEPWPRPGLSMSPDFQVELRWGDRTFSFVAENHQSDGITDFFTLMSLPVHETCTATITVVAG